jgi:hypothetical protein
MTTRIVFVCLAAFAVGCTRSGRSVGANPAGAAGPGGQPDAGSPDGRFYPVRRSPIGGENGVPGNTGWRLSNYNSGLGAYTDRTSYLPGETVSVRAASAAGTTTGTWQLWRMGYYGGKRGRLVSSGGSVPIQAQPPNVVDPATGAVSAPWAESFTFTIPADALTGIYLVKVNTPVGDTLTVLVVREKSPSAVILHVVSTNTYQAYNSWGGTSLYANRIGWKPPGASSSPWHAYAVSFDRPYENSNGTGDFLAKDRDFVTFVEGQGYDIAYATDADLDSDPTLVEHRRMLVIQGHSEYWTLPMRDAVEGAIAAGTNAAFFSANDAYWQVRFSGPSRRLLIGYKQFCGQDPIAPIDPARATCLWRDARVDRPENEMIGEMYGEAIWAAAPMQVTDPSSWIWEGTGADESTTVAGIYHIETDLRFANGVEPSGVMTVGSGMVQSYSGSFATAETSLYTASSGAQVFAAGSIGWSRTLSGAGTWDPRIRQLVANLFSVFAGEGILPAPLTSVELPSPAQPPAYRSGVQVSTVTTALVQPAAVAVAPDGSVVVADGNRIVRVDAKGSVSNVAGSDARGNLDGAPESALFNGPRGVAVAPDGTIYVSDTNNHRIRRIHGGVVSTLAGGMDPRSADGFADGPGDAARFADPMGIAIEPNGNLLVADSSNMRLREVSPGGSVSTWAGNGKRAFQNGPGPSASLYSPMAVAVFPGGDALIVEPDVGVVRRVQASATHAVSQFEGQLFVEGWDDGPVSVATAYHTVAIAIRQSDGQVVMADGASARIRALLNGNVVTLAGGRRAIAADGPGAEAGFGSPRGVAVAPDGSIYVVDAKAHALRHITGL